MRRSVIDTFAGQLTVAGFASWYHSKSVVDGGVTGGVDDNGVVEVQVPDWSPVGEVVGCVVGAHWVGVLGVGVFCCGISSPLSMSAFFTTVVRNGNCERNAGGNTH